MSRGRGFSAVKIDYLLEIIEEILPIGPNDWDRVTERHCSYYPGLGRTRESLCRMFASLYNHKTPTGDPNYPVSVRNAKRIWERIKKEMDVTDGEQGRDAEGGEGGEGGEEDEIVVPVLSPMDGAEPNEDGENGNTTVSVESGELGASGDASAGGSVAGTQRAATAVMGVGITSARVYTSRQSRAHGSSQSSNFSELMQFMLMRAKTESAVEQRCLQEREDSDAEDRHRREREEAEDRYRREREEAEERRECRIERQVQNQSDMMQIFMMGIMERRIKRKRDDEEDKEDQE